jgi:predicted amidophosphoribosyltransferase
MGDTPAAWVYLVAYCPEDPDDVPEQVIYRIKHRDDSRVFAWLAAQLAQAVARYLEAEGIPQEAVLLTYPPRRRAAVHRDGFDQAQRLAVCLSRQLGAPCLSLIRRSPWFWCRARREQEQKKLGIAQRQSNASAAYRLSGSGVNRLGRKSDHRPGKSHGPRPECRPAPAERHVLAGRFVVLVDDLCTSGSTLSACSSLLREAGASGILWATVARTVPGERERVER